eukprot:2869926-Amphidinium_carterae.1
MTVICATSDINALNMVPCQQRQLPMEEAATNAIMLVLIRENSGQASKRKKHSYLLRAYSCDNNHYNCNSKQ